jgi:hypothetical protein
MSDGVGADLARLMERDLQKLEEQLGLYPDDAGVWKVADGITNSAGTLVAHVVGGLEHYVGAVLGGSGYTRDRAYEFVERDVPRAELQERVARCRQRIVPILAGLSDADLEAPFPAQLPAHLEGGSTRLFLLHLWGHLLWHLGELDYHRRLLT